MPPPPRTPPTAATASASRRETGSAVLGVLSAPRVFWWTVFFLAWTLQVALYASVAYYRRRSGDDPLSVWEAVFASALDWYVWALICVFCLWLARRLPLDRYRWSTLVPAFVGWGLAVMLGRGLLDQAIVAALGWEYVPLLDRVVMTLPSRLIVFYLFLGLGYAVDYARRHRERELAAAHLRGELATAQLQMLKVQLHPHFLFNTLHAISSLMYTDVAAADRMLVRLSELLRRTLSTMDAQEVTLAEELSFLEPYLEIERTRLGRRLRVEMEIEPTTPDALLPHLVLQPLVENAIRHGIAPRLEGGTLRIESRHEGHDLWLIVTDDGVGLGPEGPNRAGGVGLANTRARLTHLYGERAELTIMDGPDAGVEVRLRLPFEARCPGEEAAEGPCGREPVVGATQ